MKKITLYFLLFISLFGFGISISQKALNKPEETNENFSNEEIEVKETYCTGKIIKIISDYKETLLGGNKQRTQELLIKILSGKDKNKTRVTSNIIPENPAFAIVGQLDRKYLIAKSENLNTGNEDYYIVDYYREPIIWALSIAFVFVLLIVGGFKGLRATISLLLTIGLIAFILIPLIVKGINPLLSAIVVSLLATAITMLFVAGINIKMLASTLGTGFGILISGLISTLIIKIAPLSGLASNEAMILWGNQLYEINFKGLLAAGMIVSCLGAVMDVAISISSSIQEVKIANPLYTFKSLFTAGMNVGKDIMGTMTSTLVLAYTGMALPLLLLISYEKNPAKFLNLELVVSEATAAIAGSIGLILTVPATALIMSSLLAKKTN